MDEQKNDGQQVVPPMPGADATSNDQVADGANVPATDDTAETTSEAAPAEGAAAE